MGGFEGGDEAGFWDQKPFNEPKERSIPAYFPTITAISPEVGQNITLQCIPQSCSTFTCEGAPKLHPKLAKVYQALIAYTSDEDIENFFLEHALRITKCDRDTKTEQDQLLTDVEAFAQLVNEVCNLALSPNELSTIMRLI